MKLRLKVKNTVSGSEWTEDYDILGIGDNGNVQQALDWGVELIRRYNDTLRQGESIRELISVDIVGKSTQHDWVKRTDGMSVGFRGAIVDKFECAKCGITGKRYRLLGGIKRDSKYRSNKFKDCV